MGRGRSGDEVESISEELTLQRCELRVCEIVVDAGAVDECLEPKWAVRAEPIEPAVERSDVSLWLAL